MATLLEADLQVHLFFHPLYLLKAFLCCLSTVVFCVSVHDTRVENSGSPILSDVTDQKFALLFHGF